MKDRSSTFLNVLLKLKQRHLVEWDELARNQQQVWALINEETAQKLTLYGTDRRSCASWKHKQVTRLSKVIQRQREVRAHIKVIHREEEFSLEQTCIEASATLFK